MHNTNADLLADVLQCLEQLSVERVQPEQALERVQRLRQQHGDAAIDLVWEDQAFDGSFHYDALIRPANAAKTVSVSVCPDDELPWALRGLQRWRDSELLRVNEVTMAVEQAITHLDVLWEQRGLMQRLIDSCIVTGELQRRDIQVSAGEVQAAFDGMRRRRGLYTAAALQAWMESSGVSRSSLNEMAIRLARSTKLRDVVVGPRTGEYFASHRAQFDEIKLAILEVGSEAAARSVAETVRSGAMRLLEAAQAMFLEPGSRHAEISFRQDARHALAAEFDGCNLESGAVHEQAVGDAFLVIHVLAVEPAQESPALTQRVKTKLFQDWLADQRRSARIEWFWGDAQHTAQETALN